MRVCNWSTMTGDADVVLEVMMMAAVAVVCLGSGGDRGQHRRHGRLCATWDAYARKLIERYG